MKIDIKELIKEVNAFDKKYGCRLKHPNIWLDPEMYLESFIDASDTNISNLIYLLNGVQLNEEVDDDGNSFITPPNPNDNGFNSESWLRWNDKVSVYDENSEIFKLRFLTQVLYRLLGRVDKITSRKDYFIRDDKMLSSENQIVLAMSTSKDIVRFINCYLGGDEYQNIILRMYYDMSFCKKWISYKKFVTNLYPMIMDIRHNIKSGMFDLRENLFEDDMIINILLQISYMLATGDFTTCRGVPKFKHIAGCTLKDNMFGLVEHLGKCIIESDKKHPMFKAYLEARPKITNKDYVNAFTNFELRVGMIALSFTKFMLHDNKAIKKALSSIEDTSK